MTEHEQYQCQSCGPEAPTKLVERARQSQTSGRRTESGTQAVRCLWCRHAWEV